MFIIDPVVKIIFGEIFQLSIGFIRVKAFAVAVILKILVILHLLLRTDDLHIITNAAYRKHGNDNKDNRADAAIALFRLFGLCGFLCFRRFFLSGAAFEVVLADRAGGIDFPSLAFLRTDTVSSAGITLTLPSPFSARAIRSASVTPFRK